MPPTDAAGRLADRLAVQVVGGGPPPRFPTNFASNFRFRASYLASSLLDDFVDQQVLSGLVVALALLPAISAEGFCVRSFDNPRTE